MQTIGKIIKSFKTALSDIYPENEIQAIIELVFEHYFSTSKTELFLKINEIIEEHDVIKINNIISRLKNHEPIQYIIGQTYFYNCIFKLNSNTLIPRQETEELVDWIISEHKNPGKQKILDIGTGSGCIAISLAKNIPNATVHAYDISDAALDLARENAVKNQTLVKFIKKDILISSQDEENEKFDIIVSNPPYVQFKEKEKMQKNVLDFEPHVALFVNDDNPLKFYKAIVNYAKINLKQNGKLYFEINESYGNQVVELMIKNGFSEIILQKDINGKNRMISGKFL